MKDINESRLKRIIAESVRKAINEMADASSDIDIINDFLKRNEYDRVEDACLNGGRELDLLYIEFKRYLSSKGYGLIDRQSFDDAVEDYVYNSVEI
jgi:hypothetical protein